MTEVIIPLGNGHSTVIDKIDVGLAGFEWKELCTQGTRYARRYISIGRGKCRALLLHREILAPPKGMEVDHIDGDGLNNRRSNLRICTHQQNLMNRPPIPGSRSKFKGVSTTGRRSEKWCAYICPDNKKIHLGTFGSEIDAARAYDDTALTMFGEFAWLNRDHFDEVR